MGALRGTPDFELLMNPETRIFEERFDSGGMFDAVASVCHDPVPCEKPYLATIQGSFGGGQGKRHATLEEAKQDLTRLAEAEFGVDIEF